MSFRTVTKPHMKKTVVTTVRARPVFRGAVSVAVLVMGRFMGSRASITDFADPGTDRSVPKARFWPRGGCPLGPGLSPGFPDLRVPRSAFGRVGGCNLGPAATDSPPRPQPQAGKPSGGAPLTPLPENCAFSVEPASAAVEQLPPEITCCTSSK